MIGVLPEKLIGAMMSFLLFSVAEAMQFDSVRPLFGRSVVCFKSMAKEVGPVPKKFSEALGVVLERKNLKESGSNNWSGSFELKKSSLN